VNENYEWMELYEAAVLETNPNILRGRIEDAKYALGQRVIKGAIDEAERRAVVKTLNALVLKRERSVSRNPLCYQCKDTRDLVTPTNGRIFLGKNRCRENVHIVAHKDTRCVVDWADANSFRALVPLRRAEEPQAAGR
jgi:hypothetical protein